MPSPILDIREITKSFGQGRVCANAEVSFQVARESLVCLLGPNGAGKTTLVRQITGLLRPDEGDVLLAGRSIVSAPDEASHIVASLPQAAYPLVDLTVSEAIYCAGRLRGGSHRDANAFTRREIDRWELGSVRNRVVKHLSGGQKRLVGLASTLAGRRDVLVFDEPTNDLDPRLRSRVWSTLAEARRDGRAILLITHNVHEIAQVISKVVILVAGRVVADGDLDQLRATLPDAGEFLRIELLDESLPQACRLGLLGFGTEQPSPGGRFGLRVPRERAKDLFAWIASREPRLLEQISVVQPSLEDVYFHFVAQSADDGAGTEVDSAANRPVG